MIRITVLLCGLFLSGAVLGQAKHVDFKGIPMGSTVEQVKASPGFEQWYCSNLDEDSNSCWTSKTEVTYAGQFVKYFSADFLSDKLASVSVETLGGTGNLIEQALVEKYGRPKSRYKVTQTLKNGVTYKMSVTKWHLTSGDEISIQDHPEPVNKVFTELNSSSWVKWRLNAQKATKKAKQDV